ncbi:hypothetical protein TNCV_3633321 [Trichonephila clavipes]|nr:hypothetical protein TNCV_3633321 [Trichonephila clavipes]
MSKISPFAIHKTLIGIGGEPKSVKRLRSGIYFIETMSDLQTKSGVISEPDLLSTPDAEILEGFSDQGVIQINSSTVTQTYAQAGQTFNYKSIQLPKQIQISKHNLSTFDNALHPYLLKNPLPGTSSSVSTFSTSSSSTQGNLLPSPSGILPTIQSEPLLQIPIPTTTTTTSDKNLNTLVSPLETENPFSCSPSLNLITGFKPPEVTL